MVEVAQRMLTVDLCGRPLATPLLPAAGTLSKEALEKVTGVYGAVLPKTVTLDPRKGNPPPRLAEAPSGMINSIGLPNPGLDCFLEDLDSYDVGLPIFVSTAAGTVKEFADMCERLAEDSRISAVELNLSCPNVEHYGSEFCADSETVGNVVAACRAELPDNKLLLVKLTYEGHLKNAVAAENAGADALTLINTVKALDVNAYEKKIFLRGGLSGPAIKPIALRAVYEVSQLVEIPIIGVGGVASGTDVAEFMLAGATAVQIGSGSFAREPGEILGEFASYLVENELEARSFPRLI